MNPGLTRGRLETVQITVTEDMCPSFAGATVHPTLSTVSMVYHMEWAGRKMILPFLEDCEEGIGASICINHLAPAPVGKQVTFYAQAEDVLPRKVVCRVWAEHDKARIGEGTFTQVIAPKDGIMKRIHDMR
ncbi:thioesterase [Alicyclobacillus tolerans]|uniref:thioesterase family protein n=1 Tax=Alicyclobacillus tolerans TaxID=90970 RepID=UPI001F21B3D6|nr:thioesterase [Alicyclobacillus tolerans]MCF8568082.1 thioesterase [Alicyclobacillus tolerans]